MKLRDLKEVDLNTNVSIIIYENDKILFEEGSAEAPGAYLDKVPEDYLDYKVLSLDIDDGVVEIKVKNIKPKEPKLIEQNKFLIKEHKMFRCDCCGSNMFSKYEGDKYKCQSCGQWYEVK